MKKIQFVLFSFIVWRLFLFIPLITAQFTLPYRLGYSYTNLAQFTKVDFPLTHFLLNSWANFDGIHYLSIAAFGYMNNFGFLPLYPLAIHGVSFIFGSAKAFGNTQFFSSLFIANACFLGSLILLYTMLKKEYPKEKARKMLLFLLLFPTSFYFGSIYSESLFFASTLLSFYFASKKKWILAGLFGAASSLTRIVGIAMLPALLYEFYQQEIRNKHSTHKAFLFFKSLPLFFPILSLFAYAYYNFLKTSNFLTFINAQGNFVNNRTVDSIIFFPQTVFRYTKILLTVNPIQYEWWISLLELSTFFVAGILLFIAWRKKVRTSYLIFSVLSFAIPISTGTFTGLPRYALALFPMYIAMGLLKNKWVHWSYIAISALLTFILVYAFSRGYFVA